MVALGAYWDLGPGGAVRTAVAANRKGSQACGMSESAWCDGDSYPGEFLRECLVAACAAPSIHNTQPWLFRPRGDVIDVLVDRRRQLTTLDPDGREMRVGIGASVFNLRIALGAHGRENQVSFMLDPNDPDLAARVVLERTVVPPAGAVALAGVIPHRHTNRRPFADRPVPYGTTEELAAAAELENAVLMTVDPSLRDGVAQPYPHRREPDAL